MSQLVTPEVGRLFLPNATVFGPATPTGSRPRYQGLVSYKVRSGQRGLVTQAGYGRVQPNVDGLSETWKRHEALQQHFESPTSFIDAVARRMAGLLQAPVFAHAHNERIQNGGRMEAKAFWGAASAPQVSTVNAPTYVALNNNSAWTTGNFTYAHDGTDLSLGNGATNVAAGITTNEYTTNGLSRAIGTVGAFVDASALDGVFTLTVTKTFTNTTGVSTVYGMGLFDAVSTATCNLFMEAAFATATLQISDTLAITVNVSS